MTTADSDGAYDAEFDVGKLYVWGVSLLITFIGYTSQIFVFWDLLGGLAPWTRLAVLGAFNALLHLLLYNYYLAVTVPPGHAPLGWEPPRDGANVYELKRDTLKPRYCRQCRGFKPPRTHHCADCDRCVLKMDHHCPWTNNCVGFYNQAHFLRFVYMVDVTCAVALALHVLRMYELVVDSLNGTYTVRQPTQTEVAFLIIDMTLLGLVLVLVGALSAYHAYLIARNTTTIEGREKSRVERLVRSGKCRATPYPYDLGIMRNFRSVFGPHVLLWWVPCRMPGTGLDFAIRSDLKPPVYWPPPGYTRGGSGGDDTSVQQRCVPTTTDPDLIYKNDRARVVAEVDDDGEMVIRQYNASSDPAALERGGTGADYGRSSKSMLTGFFDSGKEEEKSEAASDVDWDNDDEDWDSDDDFAGMKAPPNVPTPTALASGVRVNPVATTVTQRRSVFGPQRAHSAYSAALADYTREDTAADADDDDDETPLMHVARRSR
ncbi:Palmitoyltransferase [Coemansia sp. RSA 552]|nr:Palmitoyltransferase [Coemansia sp. RSA 552]